MRMVEVVELPMRGLTDWVNWVGAEAPFSTANLSGEQESEAQLG